jgi:hypothetical protein
MRNVFDVAPLTPVEAFQIKAFLAEVARDGAPAPTDFNFLYLGVLGMGFSLGAIGTLWASRNRGGIRQDIVERGYS